MRVGRGPGLAVINPGGVNEHGEMLIGLVEDIERDAGDDEGRSKLANEEGRCVDSPGSKQQREPAIHEQPGDDDTRPSSDTGGQIAISKLRLENGPVV